MKLRGILIPTGFAEEGMRVHDVFKLCVDAGVPAVPFRDSNGKVTGYVSLNGVMHRGCIPNYMVELAHILGNTMSCVSDAENKVKEVMANPIEPYVQSPLRSISSDAPIIKVLAILEKYGSSYLFVFDGDSYRGIVTADGIARRMLEIDSES